MNKVAIVTAGSKGIGEACARRLAKDGFDVVIMARSKNVRQVALEIKGKAFIGSVTSTGDLSDLVDFTMESFGRIDVVVNNTGHAARGELLELSDEDWMDGVGMYFLNVVRMARLVTPVMELQESGCFVNISSFAALEPSLDFPVSSSIRAALANYAKLYATRYSGRGIRMNNVLSGFVDSYPVDQSIRSQIPMGREAATHEIAAVVSFLASGDSSYITGENIKVDGGLSKGF